MSPFDVRVVAYIPGGARIGPIDVLSINASLAFSDAPSFSAKLTETTLSSLPPIVEMGLEYWHSDLDSWVEPDDARFLAKQGESDDKDPAGVVTITGVGLWHWMMSKNVIATSGTGEDPAYPDGHRPFIEALPGAIIKTILDEAHARGWAPFLNFDFTHYNDSQGVPWAEAYTIAYKPGISAWMVLSNLADQAIIEFSTSGRTLHLYRPDHGLDLSGGMAPVRIGHAATNMPVLTSIDDLITNVTVFGENALVWEFSEGATNVLGRLEGSIQQGGVSRPGTAAKLAASTLQNGRQVKRQITATENSLTAPSLPFIHYNAGDWVRARVNDQDESLRVMEVQIRKEQTITIDTILNDRFIDLLARTAKRANGILGGTNAGGSGVPPVYDDRRIPKTPIGVTPVSEGYWTPDGKAQSSLAVRWVAVTQSTDSVDMEIPLYELWFRKATEDPQDSVMLGIVRSATFGSNPYEPDAQYMIKVRAVSGKGVYSEFSAEVPITMEGPLEQLPPPTKPSLTSKLGTIAIEWDGYLKSGGTLFTLTGQFKHVYVQTSISEGGPYKQAGDTLERAGTTIITRLKLGDTHWFRLIAVDHRDFESEPSPPASVMVVGVTGPDLEANSVTSNSIDAGAITTVKLDANAVTVDKLAADAITAKHTITGAKIRTAVDRARTEMTTEGLAVYNNNNEPLVQMGFGIGTGMAVKHAASNRMVPLSHAIFGLGSIGGGEAPVYLNGPFSGAYGASGTLNLASSIPSPFEATTGMLFLSNVAVQLPSKTTAEVTMTVRRNGVALASSVQEVSADDAATSRQVTFQLNVLMDYAQTYTVSFGLRVRQTGGVAHGIGGAAIYGSRVAYLPLFSQF